MSERNELMKEIFKSIDIIAKQRIEETPFSLSITGKIIERIRNSDMYRIKYQNQEIRALSMGATYAQGDNVIILIPDKRMDNLKFILGRDNDRTPTISQGTSGLSDAVMQDIQNALDAVADISSDGKVSPSEKKSLAIEWANIQASYFMLIDESVQHEIDTSLLTEKYESLWELFDYILKDMTTTTNIPGQELRDRFGAYYGEDQVVHQLILQKIVERIGFKLEIKSTNGDQFKNHNINTDLVAIVYRGKEEITNSLETKNFIWKKFDKDGVEDTEWSLSKRNAGKQVSITSSDVFSRATFSCEIEIE